MKTFKGIDEKPKHYNDDAPKELTDSMPTFRRIMRDILGVSKADDGSEAVDLFVLSTKIKEASGPDFQFEDAEFSLLSSKVNVNPTNLTAHYYAQLILKIREANGGQ